MLALLDIMATLFSSSILFSWCGPSISYPTNAKFLSFFLFFVRHRSISARNLPQSRSISLSLSLSPEEKAQIPASIILEKGTMYVKIGLLILFMVAGSWVSDARKVAATDLLGVENAGVNADMCTLCEEYTTLALDYLEENKTQAVVMEALHKACSQFYGLKQKCITLVDYYAPLFFLEVSSVQPEEFCKKVGLCRNAGISSLSSKTNKCDLCQQAVNEVLDKLKDPDTKLEIVEILLKTCDAMEKYAKKCKNMVFEFGPLILTDAEKFIENANICTTFHACSKPTADAEESLVEGKIEMVTSS